MWMEGSFTDHRSEDLAFAEDGDATLGELGLDESLGGVGAGVWFDEDVGNVHVRVIL